MRRAGIWLLLIVTVVGGYLLFYPVPINPVSWDAPEAPALEGRYALNDRLAGVQRIAEDGGDGPEDMAVARDGTVYTGYLDGRVVRIDPDAGTVDTIANTQGRPLGIGLLPDGSLAVADAIRGLLRVTQDGEITELAVQANGLPFRFVDDLDVADDGTIYFSDASWKYDMNHLMADFFEHAGTGRLLRYNPGSGAVDELLAGLYFANGVALGPDDAYVLVTETGAYRVTRFWLKGPRAGQRDVFIDNLPGFPDNISFDERGQRFWLALYGPRNTVMDDTSDKPWLREIMYRLPESMYPEPAHLGFVLGLDTSGRVIANLQHHGSEAFGPITSAERAGEHLYFGSLSAPSMARMNVTAALQGERP